MTNANPSIQSEASKRASAARLRAVSVKLTEMYTESRAKSVSQPNEAVLRRRLTKHGYQLNKRNGGYMISDANTRAAVSGYAPVPYSDDMDDVRNFLREECGESV